MSQWRVTNAQSGETILARAKYCASFLCRLRGLMFAGQLTEGEGIVLVASKPGRLSTSIHTFGLRYEIAVIWLNEFGLVVDKARTKPWRYFYSPVSKAKVYIESMPSLYDRADIGDRIRIECISRSN